MLLFILFTMFHLSSNSPIINNSTDTGKGHKPMNNTMGIAFICTLAIVLVIFFFSVIWTIYHIEYRLKKLIPRVVVEADINPLDINEVRRNVSLV